MYSLSDAQPSKPFKASTSAGDVTLGLDRGAMGCHWPAAHSRGGHGLRCGLNIFLREDLSVAADGRMAYKVSSKVMKLPRAMNFHGILLEANPSRGILVALSSWTLELEESKAGKS